MLLSSLSRPTSSLNKLIHAFEIDHRPVDVSWASAWAPVADVRCSQTHVLFIGGLLGGLASWSSSLLGQGRLSVAMISLGPALRSPGFQPGARRCLPPACKQLAVALVASCPMAGLQYVPPRCRSVYFGGLSFRHRCCEVRPAVILAITAKRRTAIWSLIPNS